MSIGIGMATIGCGKTAPDGDDGGSDASSACPGPAGALDPAFADAGVATTLFGAGSNYSEAFGVAVQPNGSVVIAGGLGGSSANGPVLARFTDTGALDPSFGAGAGYVTTNASATQYSAVASLPSGSIVAAGYQKKAGFVVQRYDATGAIDPSFGAGGTATVSFPQPEPSVARMAVQADGRIVIFGTVGDGISYQLALARLDAGGKPDATFGNAGVVTISLPTANAFAAGMVVDEDGSLLCTASAIATSGSPPPSRHLLIRVDGDGTLDPAFGTNGIADLASGAAGGVALSADRSIYVAGSQDGKYLLAHVDGTGSLDTAFGSSGVAWATPAGQSGAVDLVIQRDGKIVVGGVANLGQLAGSAVAIARFLPAGTLDATFGTAGMMTTGRMGGMHAMASSSDCSVVMVGSVTFAKTTVIQATLARASL